MSLSLERMRYRVREGLGGLSESDMDDTDVDELLNLSLWEIEDKFSFTTKRKRVETLLVVDQYIYDVTGIIRLDAIHSIAVIDSNGNRKKLARMTRDWLDENFQSEEKGTPERYLREGCTLTVYPIPDEALDLEISVQQGVASLAEGTVEATGLPRNWDEIVVQGAIWRGHYFKEDYNLAQQAVNFQLGLIRNAVPVDVKEERDSRYAGLDVLTEWPVDE